MNCQDFDNRLYDEDCRKALLGESDVPEDMRNHLHGCPHCREIWSEAEIDTRLLSKHLLFEAPPSLALFPPPEQLAPISLRYLVDWVDLGRAFSTGAIVSTLIAILPSSNFLWQWSGFWFGAAIGLAAVLLESQGLLPLPKELRLQV